MVSPMKVLTKVHPLNLITNMQKKYLAEEIFKEWQKKDENSLIIIRPTVVFGEGNRATFSTSKANRFKRFVMVGNGKNKKSMAMLAIS